MTKLIFAYRSFADAPKMGWKNRSGHTALVRFSCILWKSLLYFSCLLYFPFFIITLIAGNVTSFFLPLLNYFKYTVMRHITTFQSMTDRIYNGGPIRLQGGREVTIPRPIRYHNLIWITYVHLVTCPVDPYVHLDAGHTNGCASMSSVTYIGAFLE